MEVLGESKLRELGAGAFLAVAQGNADRDAHLHELHGKVQVAFEIGGIDDIDYVALVDPKTLHDVDQVNSDTRALIAARVGTTRLIDNIRLGAP